MILRTIYRILRDRQHGLGINTHAVCCVLTKRDRRIDAHRQKVRELRAFCPKLTHTL
ncbi:hypothetical protein HanIR_Chr06g0258221 [Helianthus annuus]|nr:hypothetical protein HanIR_Chr06g0258221 [Helianthus annuus]